MNQKSNGMFPAMKVDIDPKAIARLSNAAKPLKRSEIIGARRKAMS
jgi:hypothetical protein